MHLLTSKICYRALHINCSSQEPAPPCTLRACVSPRKLHPPPRSQEKGQACSPGPGLTCCAVAPRPEHGKQGELQPARRPRAKGLLCYWPSGPWAPPPGSGDKGSPIPGQWGPRRQTVGTLQADSGDPAGRRRAEPRCWWPCFLGWQASSPSSRDPGHSLNPCTPTNLARERTSRFRMRKFILTLQKHVSWAWRSERKKTRG